MCIHSSKYITTIFKGTPVRKIDEGNIKILQRTKKKAQIHVVHIYLQKKKICDFSFYIKHFQL